MVNKSNLKNQNSDDDDYIEENVVDSYKRKRSKSESDIYFFKIVQRSKNDNYFKEQSKDKQIDILRKEDEIYNYYNRDIPLRYKIIYSSLHISTKLLLIQKIDIFDKMSNYDCEYNKFSKWINGLSLIPFDNYVEMPITIKNNNTDIQKFLWDSFNILENTIYGQKKAKNKILQILGQWISNPKSNNQIIALEGSPGVGKTCLIKNGVSKALHRPFCFYALGGANDISVLEGHSYTYEGAHWGKLIEMLMQSKVMNPIIFFDELDKISNTVKGNEIIGLLTHLTDNTQNSLFNDKYFSEISIDFSKSLFFFSFNDIELLNPVLKDRLTIVKFDSYNILDKIEIIKKFILPDVLNNIGLNNSDIIINDDIIKYLILKYTNNEDGVRNIKKIIETLLLKINLIKLLNNKDDVSNNLNHNLELINYNIKTIFFPLNITTEIADILLNE